jgi:hypothetical protein
MTTFRKYTLYFNAVFLMTIGGVLTIFDIVGYAWGTGPMGEMLHDSSYAIGFVEAHALAFIIGVVLLLAARRPDRRWNALGLAVHALLATANLSFWSVYAEFDLVTMGVVSTTVHVLLVMAHAFCLLVPAHRTAEALVSRA